MCINGYLRKCFEICFISIETDIECMTDTVRREKVIGQRYKESHWWEQEFFKYYLRFMSFLGFN